MAGEIYPLPISGRTSAPTLRDTISSSTTWTVPVGVDEIFYIAVGGGAGGGPSWPQFLTYSNPVGPGYGGGSGYVSSGMISGLSQRPNAAIQITIGAGGGSGARGGITQIDGIWVAGGGGQGGQFSNSSGNNLGISWGGSAAANSNGAGNGGAGGPQGNLVPTFAFPPGGPNGSGNTANVIGGGGGGGAQPPGGSHNPGNPGGSGAAGVVYLYY